MIFKRVPRRDRYAAARPWVHILLKHFVTTWGSLSSVMVTSRYLSILWVSSSDSLYRSWRLFSSSPPRFWGFPVKYDVVVQGVDVVLPLEANVIRASSNSFAQWQNYARAFCASRYDIRTECPDCEGTYPECPGRKIALCIAHWDSSPSSAKHDFLWHLSVRLHRKVSETSTSIGIRRG